MVINVTCEVKREVIQSDALLAQQKECNVLILTKLSSSVRRFDGKAGKYCLEHRWLSDKNNVHSVQGNDFTYWTAKEMKPMLSDLEQGKTLFDLFALIG